MSKQTVLREITVEVCDFCEKEYAESPEKCGLCKRVGHNFHMAYTVEVYRYHDHQRQAGFGRHVCQGCAAKPIGDGPIPVTVATLLDRMVDQ